MFAHWNPHQGVNPILRKATLEIPLLDSVVPTKGSAPMSFTRASVRRELDYSGLFVGLLSGEVGFRGARRVENLALYSSLNSAGATVGAAGGTTPPTITATTFEGQAVESVVFPVGGSGYAFSRRTGSSSAEFTKTKSTSFDTAKRYTWRVRLALSRQLVGSEALVLYVTGAAGMSNPGITLNSSLCPTMLTDLAKVADAPMGSATGSNGLYAYIGSALSTPITLYLERFQIEDVTGQSNQNPSEYVSVGAAKLNELLYTEEFDNAYWTKQANVTLTPNQAANPLNGAVNADLWDATGAVTTGVLRQLSGCTAGGTYTLSCYLKNVSGSAWVRLLWFPGGGTDQVRLWVNTATGLAGTASATDSATLADYGVEVLDNGWCRAWVSGATTVTTPYAQVATASGDGNTAQAIGANYIFGMQVTSGASLADYFPVGNVYPFHGAMVDGVKWFPYENGNTVSGNVVTEARGPDIPYPQVLKGYVPFPAATNLLTYANDLSNAAWTAVNATKPQATQWPRLRPEALPFRIVDDSTAAAPHGVSRTGGTTITANTNYCLWVAVHSSGERYRGFLQLVDTATGTNGFYVSFNARTGAVAAATSGSGTLAASGYINIAKGWGIVYVSGKIDAASTSAVGKLFTLDDDGNLVRDGDGASAMIVDHFQLELGTVPTNIIPTTSSAIFAAGDVLTAVFVRNGGGAMSIECERDNTGWSSIAATLSNGATNTIMLACGSGVSPTTFAYIDNAGVNQVNLSSAGAMTLGRRSRLAVSFNTDDTRLVKDGGTILSDTSCSIPQTVEVRFGINGAVGQVMMSPIAYFRAWDTPLTDAELKAITANGYRDETVNLLTGWNDSSFISRDGRRLYFAYAPLFPYPFLLTQDYSYAPNGPTRRGSPGYTSIENSFDLYCAHLRHDGTVERIECLNLNTATDSHFACMEFMGSPWRLYMGYMNDGQTETRMRSAAIDANGKWTLNATSEFDAIHAGGADLGFNDDNPHVVLGTVCVFASGRTSGAVGGTDIWLATRAAIGDPWGTPVNPGVINTLGNEDQFYMHANMVDCYFSRDGEIWHVTWNGGGFNNDAAKVTFAVSPALLIGECSIPDDFSYLYFTQIDQTTGVSRIMRAPWTGSKTAWGTPVAVD